jgi:hypothetical protein
METPTGILDAEVVVNAGIENIFGLETERKPISRKSFTGDDR